MVEIYNSAVASRSLSRVGVPGSASTTRQDAPSGWLMWKGRSQAGSVARTFPRTQPRRYRSAAAGEAIQCAPQFGLKTLTAGAFAHNEPSLKIFEDFGFERWAHYPKVAELDGVERDLGVLGLRLDDPVAGAYRPSSCGLDLRGST